MIYLSLVISGCAVAQLVETLHHKSERRGLDSRWGLWNLLLNHGFGIIASKRSAYPGPFLRDRCVRCVGMETLSHSCDSWLNIQEASTSRNSRGVVRRVQGELYLPRQLAFKLRVWGVREVEVLEGVSSNGMCFLCMKIMCKFPARGSILLSADLCHEFRKYLFIVAEVWEEYCHW